jgi:hypothetical protein
MSNQILLARPHPFIVSEMKPFLEQSGFSPLSIKDIRELARLASTTFGGAIISLAVQSTIDESAETIFESIRKQFPYLPVAFAGMLDATMANKAIKRVLPTSIDTHHILAVEKNNERRVELGQPSTFVYIRNRDLSTPDTVKIAALMLQRHFSVKGSRVEGKQFAIR